MNIQVINVTQNQNNVVIKVVLDEEGAATVEVTKPGDPVFIATVSTGLDGNELTITISNFVAGGKYHVKVTQGPKALIIPIKRL